MKFEKDSSEWKFFQDFWQFVQKYYEVKNTDKYWEEMQKDGNKIASKYERYDTKTGRLAMKLLLAFYDFEEKEYKKNND